MLAGRRGPPGVDLESHQLAARLLQSQAEPQPGVAGRRADLGHALRAHGFREEPQRPAVAHRDAQVRPSGASHLFEHGEDFFLRFRLGQGKRRIRAPRARPLAEGRGRHCQRQAESRQSSHVYFSCPVGL